MSIEDPHLRAALQVAGGIVAGRNETAQESVSPVACEQVEHLFASPLVHLRITEAPALNPALIQEIERIRAAGPGIQRSNRLGWHSADDLFQRSEPGLTRLRTLIVEAVRLATIQVAPRFDFAGVNLQLEGWINASDRHAYNAPHTHPGFAWSGSYYVSVPPGTGGDSGAIEFFDPRTNTRVPTINGAACFLDTRKLRPEAGTLLVFPSYLLHWVHPNEHEATRISVAFNARFVPKVCT